MTTMTPIKERLNNYHLAGFVAMDTVDAFADRILAVVRDRTMVVVSQYRSSRPDERPRPSLGSLDVKPGLWRDQHATRYEGGIDRWSQVNPVGKGVHLHLKPGFNGFGIGAHEYESPTEQAVRDRYHSDGYYARRNLTFVRIEGWPGDRNERTDDRIHIERWNEHGVCVETLVLFVEKERWA